MKKRGYKSRSSMKERRVNGAAIDAVIVISINPSLQNGWRSHLQYV